MSCVVCSGEGLEAKQQQIPGLSCSVAVGRDFTVAPALESDFSPCLQGRGTLGHPYHTTGYRDDILCMEGSLPVSTGFSEQCYYHKERMFNFASIGKE